MQFAIVITICITVILIVALITVGTVISPLLSKKMDSFSYNRIVGVLNAWAKFTEMLGTKIDSIERIYTTPPTESDPEDD